MTTICDAEVSRKGPVTYPCTCCGSPVKRENVYCPRCLQAIRAGTLSRFPIWSVCFIAIMYEGKHAA